VSRETYLVPCEYDETEDFPLAIAGSEQLLPDPAVFDPTSEEVKTSDTDEIWKRYGLLSPKDVDLLCSQSHGSKSFVEGLVSYASVSFLVGDSGLGKSPLAYQLALCVAQGIPFLGMRTNQAHVVYADYENGLKASKELRDSLVRFLGIGTVPESFHLWSADAATRSLNLEGICEDVKPDLLVLDTLRSHDSEFEKADVGGGRMADLRSLAARHKTAVLAIHHIRKPGPEGTPALDSDDIKVMDWLNVAAGHRSIINQSDTRIATSYPSKAHAGELVLRWHRRVYGEGGPQYVERAYDDDGKPIGYRVITGIKLLNNPEQEAAFQKLAREFSFKEAKYIYGRSDDPTKKWLNKCESVGVLVQTGRGTYRRTDLP
jgi:hypothetical protein